MLYPYQHTGAAFLRDRSRALLCDQMGLGKTAQALAALPSDASVLVLCPASLRHNWCKEAETFAPHFRTEIVENEATAELGKILVCNYDRLSSVQISPVPTHLILDEAHAVKNPAAMRTQIVQEMARVCDVVWALTGTPMLNKPSDLWTLLYTLELHESAFGGAEDFDRLFNAQRHRVFTRGRVIEKIRYGTPDPLVRRKLGRVALWRLRKDVLPELPTKSVRDVLVDGSFGCRDFDPTAAAVRRDAAIAKCRATREYLEAFAENDEPVVVFSDHVTPVERLAEHFGYGLITGKVDKIKRGAIVDSFQAGELPGIALTIGAGATGLTLTHAAHVVFNDLSWTAALNEQAEDRACRIGQTRGVTIHRLFADNPVDDVLRQVNARKARNMRAIAPA